MNLSNQVVTRDVVTIILKRESQLLTTTTTRKRREELNSRRIETSNVNFDNDFSMLRIPPFDVPDLELLSVLFWPDGSFVLLRVFEA